MFSLNTHLAILIVMAYVVFAAWFAPTVRKLWQWQKKYCMHRTLDKIMAELKQFGPLWIMHEIDGMCAVCTYSDFKRILADWSKKVSTGSEAWSKQILHVPVTFTCCKEEMKVCTGTDHDILGICTDLIYDLLGRKYGKLLIRKHIRDLIKPVVKEDNRLYVPFIGNKWNPEWESYCYTTVDAARRRLHRCVLDAIPATLRSDATFDPLAG